MNEGMADWDLYSSDLAWGPRLAEEIGAVFKKIVYKEFGNYEMKATITDPPRGRVIVAERPAVTRFMENASNPNTYLVNLYNLLDYFQGLGMDDIQVVMPLEPFARQERKFLEGENDNFRVALRILRELGASKFYTVTAHMKEWRDKDRINTIDGLEGYNINGFQALGRYLRDSHFDDPLVLGADMTANAGSETVRQIMDVELSDAIPKKRDPRTGKVERGDFDYRVVHDKDVILADDIIASGDTMHTPYIECKRQGARTISAAAVHSTQREGLQRYRNSFHIFVVTDTVDIKVPKYIAGLSVASVIPDLGETIREANGYTVKEAV